jgi:SAM-dependent methyltransferase
MAVTLTTTWYPRGELPRFARLLPLLENQYAHIVICYIPGDDPSIQEQFSTGSFSTDPQIKFCVNDNRRNGRNLALQKALETPAEYIHYADLDRLLHWVETQPEEWKRAVAQVEQSDCVIFGRTGAAMMTHPQALITTEVTSNRVVSHFLGQQLDVSAGSKSFSRAGAAYIIEHGTPDDFSGTDAEWPMLLRKAGFALRYVQVDGLDWESADQFMPRAATSQEQAHAAQQYDADPAHWRTRVEIADRIIKAALRASPGLPPVQLSTNIGNPDFDFEAVFEVDDYLYFYQETLTDERTEAEVRALVSLLELDRPTKILDLACGYGRHANRLAALGHTVTGIDLTSGFLDIARKDANERHDKVTYLQGDMRQLSYTDEFERVMLLFTTFGYFDDEANLQVLVNIKNALKPGGLLIFDLPNRDVQLRDMKPAFVIEKEGNLMVDRLSFDNLHGRLVNKRIVIRDGIRKDKPFSIRLYNPNEIQGMIDKAGMELYHLYGGLDGKEYSAEMHRMVVVARKPDQQKKEFI